MALTNAVIGELLCREGEDRARGDQQRRALRRAGRAAFRWPVEAAALRAAGRSLTELRYVGPWLETVIGGWLDDPPVLAQPPPLRSGFLCRTEVDALLAGRDARTIRGDLQMHTHATDGTASIREMAYAAAARGLSYVAVTDHASSLRIAHGLTDAELDCQGREIADVNRELGGSGFRVLHAVEMNLSPTGEGDVSADCRAGLDLVLGAFHSKLRVAGDQTERYVAAIRHSGLDVLAHPRGRIFDFRAGLRADWPRVFSCAREYGRAVEVDGYPDRQDLDVPLLRLARDTGAMISLGSDAHAPGQLEFLDFGIAAARAAGVPDDQILNCKTADELVAWRRASRR